MKKWHYLKLIILLATVFWLLATLNSTFGQQCPPGTKPTTHGNEIVCVTNPKGDLGEVECFGGFCPTLTEFSIGTTMERIFSTLLGLFTVVAGLMLIIYFVLGAMGWLTAGGDQEKLKKAQQQITNAVMGLILVVAAYSVIFALGKVLGLEILNPAAMLPFLNPLSNPPASQ